MSTSKSRQSQPRRLWRRFLSETRGAAALEFAFIAPFMLLLYLLAMEFSLAIELNKKVNRIASQVADLVTQQPSIRSDDLKEIMKIGSATLQPFDGDPAITVTAIEITNDGEPEAKVVWALRKGKSTKPLLKEGEKTSVPDAMMVPGAFFIRSEAELHYWPIIAPVDGSRVLGMSDIFPLPFDEGYYMAPRMTHRIECEDC